jgi:hypothetical protein
MMNQVASQTEIEKNMLETVTLQRIPPVAARRCPPRRVITRPRPGPEVDELCGDLRYPVRSAAKLTSEVPTPALGKIGTRQLPRLVLAGFVV